MSFQAYSPFKYKWGTRVGGREHCAVKKMKVEGELGRVTRKECDNRVTRGKARYPGSTYARLCTARHPPCLLASCPSNSSTSLSFSVSNSYVHFEPRGSNIRKQANQQSASPGDAIRTGFVWDERSMLRTVLSCGSSRTSSMTIERALLEVCDLGS